MRNAILWSNRRLPLIAVTASTLLTAVTTWAGVLEDNFDRGQPDAKLWKVEPHGEPTVHQGAAYLFSNSLVPTRLELAEKVPDDVYGLRFDFRPDADHQDGYAFVVQHGEEGSKSIYWYLEFMAAVPRVSAYRHVNHQWTHCGAADLTLGGKVNPFATWYRVEVRNQPKQVTVRVFVRETGEGVWQFEVAHDGGPPAPLFFAANAGTPKVKPDLAGQVDNFYLAGRTLAGEPLPTPSGKKPLLSIGSKRIQVGVEEDGSVFLFRSESDSGVRDAGRGTWDERIQSQPSGSHSSSSSSQAAQVTSRVPRPLSHLEPFACVLPSAQVLGESRLAPLIHERTRPEGEAGFTQDWYSEAAAVRLRLRYTLPPDRPWITVRMSLVNGEAKEKQVRVGLRLSPTQGVGEATRGISFRRQWITSSEPIDTELDFLQPIQSIPWGTLPFCLSKEEIAGTTVFDPTTGGLIPGGKSKFELYLPLVSVTNERGGGVLFADPRAAFLFDMGSRGVGARHVFFLKGEEGFRDSGFFNGDAAVDYVLHLGYPEKTDWSYLWRRYFCEANPWLRRGPKAPTGPYTAGLPEAKDTRSVKRFVALGTRYVGAGDIFHPEKDLEAQAASISVARRKGMRCLLWTNIRMAPAPPTFGWDPKMDYRKFEDSWIRGPEGKPQKCWDGYNCNPSPKFSLAKEEFGRLTGWILKHKLDGIFLDLYGDTTDVDPTRTYAHFPFYPLQVAETEWMKLLADWCNKHGKIVLLNCPHPSLMVAHLAHLLSGDTWGPLHHVSMVERMMAASAGKPHLLLGPFEKPEDHGSGEWLRCSLRAMFYGEMVCQWQAPLSNLTEEGRRDLATVDWLFIRSVELNRLLADSELQGGDPFTAFWFKHPSGQGFITLNNETSVLQRPRVTLDRYVRLSGVGQYKVILWDLVGDPLVLMKGKADEVQRWSFQPALAPGQAKVLAFVDEGTAKLLLSQAVKADHWKTSP